ncbi:MAG TPA: peptide-methionine (S)-S-oxide reductase MsrA [Candidatus Saccharimonadales bacterium]|nr:peptide-methionine (S)-S-oxide reductase MsrA [Candidatus Saccharimonadales bacterium]
MAKTESIVLGGGCFWCLEAAYQMINGVTKVTSGYSGGTVPDPSYYAVCTGRTGHAEVVKVEFDPGIISLADILDIFWAIHDPTTLNRQGYDVGTQYRSIIFFESEGQKRIAEQSKVQVAKLWPNKIVTTIEPLKEFFPAEPEHQNYFKNHPERAYCQVVINPKLAKLRQKFADKLLKE